MSGFGCRAIGRVLVVGLALGGCAAPQRVVLTPAHDQQAIIRNGMQILASNKRHLVMLRPNARSLGGNARPAFTLIVRNQGKKPETLHEAGIRAWQVIDRNHVGVRVFRYDELIQEEETRQKVAAFGAALSGFGRAMSAANAGNVTTTGTVTTQGPYGTTFGTYSASTYDPARAQMAQSIAAAETSADFERLRAQGEANLRALDATILKDNTVMPGNGTAVRLYLHRQPNQRAAERTTP
jgi:hypothetical protein